MFNRKWNNHDPYPYHPEPDHQNGRKLPRFLISEPFSPRSSNHQE